MLWWRFWKRQSGEFCIGCNWIPCFCIRCHNWAWIIESWCYCFDHRVSFIHTAVTNLDSKSIQASVPVGPDAKSHLFLLGCWGVPFSSFFLKNSIFRPLNTKRILCVVLKKEKRPPFTCFYSRMCSFIYLSAPPPPGKKVKFGMIPIQYIWPPFTIKSTEPRKCSSKSIIFFFLLLVSRKPCTSGKLINKLLTGIFEFFWNFQITEKWKYHFGNVL